MSIQRNLAKLYTPQAQRGFLGAGHLASPLIQVAFSESDPFIVLMDDRLEKRDEQPVGGPHPHAGFETVSLLLEGEMGDEAYRMSGGDLQLMTAGSGVIHTETIEREANMRLLQLWLTLPKKDRWATPRVQDIPLNHVPRVTNESVDIKVYSGSLAGVTSPVQNYTPLILADIWLAPHASTVQYIPAPYTAFLYAIEGSVEVGDAKKQLMQDQVGWLDRFADDDVLSELRLTAGETGGRVILYAGERQGDEIVSHGPFIGDTQEDIRRLYQDYRQGKLNHIATLPQGQHIHY
ncbi:pirin family protein [Spirosoma sp. KCTC 42546]|uniref:pirin family protein n=1 Tax=Spirosoma sp. KCTC 42546 TaxID=2520506 RepID=UPI00115927FB|nr:pirin-like C-terminal cupin domain-containing protein [Spirosoma sp. KCTC 42546]QDK82547.1 pirin family protein [Spirosoma sp. KCTC 42546]